MKKSQPVARDRRSLRPAITKSFFIIAIGRSILRRRKPLNLALFPIDFCVLLLFIFWLIALHDPLGLSHAIRRLR